VRVVREEAGLSERRACGLIGMHRGAGITSEKTERRCVAGSAARFGYRRLYVFLRREKTQDGTLR
jgi:hypothetical protein